MVSHKILRILALVAMLVSLLPMGQPSPASATVVPSPAGGEQQHGLVRAGQSHGRDEGSALLRPLSELGQQPVHAP